jgi:hypothetical protein
VVIFDFQRYNTSSGLQRDCTFVVKLVTGHAVVLKNSKKFTRYRHAYYIGLTNIHISLKSEK